MGTRPPPPTPTASRLQSKRPATAVIKRGTYLQQSEQQVCNVPSNAMARAAIRATLFLMMVPMRSPVVDLTIAASPAKRAVKRPVLFTGMSKYPTCTTHTKLSQLFLLHNAQTSTVTQSAHSHPVGSARRTRQHAVCVSASRPHTSCPRTAPGNSAVQRRRKGVIIRCEGHNKTYHAQSTHKRSSNVRQH